MASSVHFRFKSAREFESLSFEGDFVKVADLKVAIVERKKLNFGEGFDLEISDASTGDVFADENSLVQKNASVIVRRIPGLKPGGILSHQDMAGKNERYAEKNNKPQENTTTEVSDPNEPKVIEGADEEDRIQSLIMQSAVSLEQFPLPPSRGRYGHRGGHRDKRFNFGGRNQSGNGMSNNNTSNNNNNNVYPDRAPRPGHNYVCHRCNKPGHWIDQCPTNGDPTYDKIKVRPPTGIPRSMLRQVDAPESGTGLQDSSGHFVTLQPNEEEFARQTVGLRLSQAAAAQSGKVPVIGGPSEVTESLCALDTAEQSATDAPDAKDVPRDSADKSQPPPTNDAAPSGSTGAANASAAAPPGLGEAPDSTGIAPKPGNPVNRDTGPSGPSSEGGGGRSQGARNMRHMNKMAPHGRRGNMSQPHGIPPPSMPMPGVPPGFPPMGMPFPHGMPPPPQFLMAMAAMAAQNGGMPLHPGQIPPNVPMPFAPPMSMSGPGHSGAAPDNPGRPDKENSGPGSQGGAGDVVNLEKADDRHERAGSGIPPQKMDGTGKSFGVGKGEDRDINTNGLKRDEQRQSEHDNRLDQSDVERIETAVNSKSHSPHSSGRHDTEDKRDGLQTEKYDSERPRRHRHDERGETEAGRGISPRCRAPPEKGRGSRDVPHGEAARLDARVTRREDGAAQRGVRRARRGGWKDVSPKGDEEHRGRPRGDSPRGPPGSSRPSRRSPSPRSASRGRRISGKGSPDRKSRRSRSPNGRHRYGGSPRDRYRGTSGQRERGAGRERVERPRCSPRRRGEGRSKRGRSLSPPPAYDATRRGRDDSRPRHGHRSRADRSPEPVPGRRGSPPWGDDDGRYRGRRGEETESKRRKSMPSVREENEDGTMNGAKSRRDEIARRAERFENGSKDWERSPRRESRRSDRAKRDRDGGGVDDSGDGKRFRLDGLRREERRERPSVHDRLGRPLRDRTKPQRRSVHDRLG